MLYVLVGLVTLVVVPGVALAAAVVAAKLMARHFGLPNFRLGARSTPSTRWKLFSVRGASVAGAFLTCFILAFAGARMTGTYRPTMSVTVHEGPAREAGVKDGDRIVAIDGKPCSTFEALRDELRSNSGAREVTVERNSERITLVVIPTAEHRIGVEQRAERHPSSIGEAATSAIQATMSPFRYLMAAFSLASGSEKVTMVGPVAIVKGTGQRKEAGLGPVFLIAAVLASFVWPVVLLVHILDAFLSRGLSRDGGNA